MINYNNIKESEHTSTYIYWNKCEVHDVLGNGEENVQRLEISKRGEDGGMSDWRGVVSVGG